MPEDLTSTDETVPWILRQAAERRAAGGATVEDDPADELDDPAGELDEPPAYTRPPRPEWQPSAPAWTPPRPPASSPYDSPYAPPPTRRRLSLGVSAGIVSGAVILAGAGIGGVALLTKGGTPSPTAFVADADDACRTGNRLLADIARPADYAALATAAGTFSAALSSQVDRLRGMPQPGGSAGDEVAAVYGAMERAGQAAGRLQDAARLRDDPAAVAAANDLSVAADEASTQASSAGFEACAMGIRPAVDTLFDGTGSAVRASYLAVVELHCRRAASDIGAIHIPEGATGRDFAAYFGATVDIVDRLVADIRALPVPPGDEDEVDDILRAQEAAQAKEREFHEAAAEEDFERMDVLYRDIAALLATADAKWDAYGLRICGSQFGA